MNVHYYWLLLLFYSKGTLIQIWKFVELLFLCAIRINLVIHHSALLGLYFQMHWCAVKGDRVKVPNRESQIYIISFSPVNLLSMDRFQKLNFWISWFIVKYPDPLILRVTWITSCKIRIFKDQQKFVLPSDNTLTLQ